MIYNELWELDQNHAGCSVSKRNNAGEWEFPDADILLDEQTKASGKTDLDYAAKPLFAHVKPEIFERPTYKSLIGLLNNYMVHYRLEETTTQEEQAEIDEFLAHCLESVVFIRAWKYIESITGRSVAREEMLAHMNRLWFAFFTNYYNGQSTHHCSGFEHVFVGEGKYGLGNRAIEGKGQVSGYHNWVKYYIDENIRNVVDYHGHWYKLQGNSGTNNVNVCTMQMVWTHSDIEGNVRTRMFKKMGGFFVGSSPELELTFGTVAYFENEVGVFSGDRRHAIINEHPYNLVLYRNALQGGGRGHHVRSFYPAYLGASDNILGASQNMGSTVAVPPSVAFKNEGAIRIAAALPNPVGSDDHGEWVELVNVTDETIDLTGWYLRDKANRKQTLSGEIQAGKTTRIAILRADMYDMQLGNSGGSIEVVNNQGVSESGVTYLARDVSSGQVIQFTAGGSE